MATSPIIYDTLSGSKTARAIVASDTAIGSGVIQSGMIGDNAVTSGNIASGQVDHFHLADNSVQSGNIASGQVSHFHLADNSVQSGNIASGQVSHFHISSGAIGSGQVASGAVEGSLSSGAHNIASGTIGADDIGSGQIHDYHLASGFSVTAAQTLIDTTFRAANGLSGGRAVSFTTSGTIQHADPNNGATMPAVGVIATDYASGDLVTFQDFGRMYNAEFNFSGGIGRKVFIVSGSTLHWVAPPSAGAFHQMMGVAVSVSGAMLNTDTELVKI